MANIKSQIKRNRQNEKRARAQQGGALRAEDPHEAARWPAPSRAPRRPRALRLAVKRIDKARPRR